MKDAISYLVVTFYDLVTTEKESYWKPNMAKLSKTNIYVYRFRVPSSFGESYFFFGQVTIQGVKKEVEYLDELFKSAVTDLTKSGKMNDEITKDHILWDFISLVYSE